MSKHTHHTNSKVVIIEQFLLSLTQNLAKKIYSQKITIHNLERPECIPCKIHIKDTHHINTQFG